ncbi:acyltransferase family protein [Pannonibacter sp. Pt2]|uniref:Acyltransferase family protein n=1 Tax=Pannonibacter anstelovis TaxID=3121537 RepID=A0ABU7ZKZ2_9HYPH
MNYLDLIRTSAMFMVIGLHSSSENMYKIASTPPDIWGVSNIIVSMLRICVPLFFILSGYLILSSESKNDETPLHETGRRILKVILPLLIWSIAYRFYIAYGVGETFNFSFIISSLRSISQEAVTYHLWFLYEIIVIYMLIPVLRPLVRESDDPAIYFCCLWLFLSTLQAMAFLLNWNYVFGGRIDLGNIGYFVAGYLVRKHISAPRPIDAAAAAICFLVCAVITTLLTARESYAAGRYVEFLHVYSAPNVIFMSLSAFVVLLYVGRRIYESNLALAKLVISSVASCSFGIYLLHVLVLERMNYNIVGETANSPSSAILNIALTVLGCFAVCWPIIWCLRLSKMTRWLVP